MTNLQINKAVRNGIEFWVSNDASQVGMSLSGLNVMVPCSLRALADITEAYSNSRKLPSRGLEDLRSKGLAIVDVAQERGGKPVKFIPAELCYEIISYYALEARKISDDVRKVAITNMKACGSVGMKMFILNQVGYKVASPEQKSDSDRLDFIISEMREMKELTQRYVNIKENTKNKPGLEAILEDYEKGYLLSDGKYFTIPQWLKAKGVDLTHGQKVSLGMAIHATFKTHGRSEAPTYNGVRQYTIADITLLETALRNLN